MNDKLFIPKNIKVGYQHCDDTYTKMLAYVIYYDSKGKLCKETSWKGWIQDKPRMDYVRDDKYNPIKDEHGQFIMREISPALPVHDFENVPTSGFVLNKKAGGTNSGWNHRQMKCRVFDPRGFEFEIAIDNLLFILQETNSYKGKGLEGEFVYAWAGKNIILLPCESEDYKQSQVFTDMKTMKVSAKELKEGYTYIAKDTSRLVYMGKFDYINYTTWRKLFSISKEFIFFNINTNEFVAVKPTNIVKVSDASMANNYAELITQLQNSGVINTFEVVITPTNPDIKSEYMKNWNELWNDNKIADDIFLINKDGTYSGVHITVHFDNIRDAVIQNMWRTNYVKSERESNSLTYYPYVPSYFQMHIRNTYKIEGGTIVGIETPDYDYNKKITFNEVEAMKFVEIELKFIGGKIEKL